MGFEGIVKLQPLKGIPVHHPITYQINNKNVGKRQLILGEVIIIHAWKCEIHKCLLFLSWIILVLKDSAFVLMIKKVHCLYRLRWSSHPFQTFRSIRFKSRTVNEWCIWWILRGSINSNSAVLWVTQQQQSTCKLRRNDPTLNGVVSIMSTLLTCFPKGTENRTTSATYSVWNGTKPWQSNKYHLNMAENVSGK